MIQDDDPRLTGDHVRRLAPTETGGEATLVGVVHDHPASTYRTRRLTEAVDSDSLALELPPLAIPLFVEYARDTRTPPTFGGEMSSAIQGADVDRVVGIDGPSLGFVRYLIGTLLREQYPRETIREVMGSLAAVSKHAAVYKFAELLARTTGLRVEVDPPLEHDAEWTDPPPEQARDEKTQIRRARTVQKAFQSSSAGDVRKSTRERYMADRIEALREEGSVVAVLGLDHLEPVADRLEGTE